MCSMWRGVYVVRVCSVWSGVYVMRACGVVCVVRAYSMWIGVVWCGRVVPL